MYVYAATLIRVVDGDTVWLDVDLGFDCRRRDSFRLFGVDTPELPTAEGIGAKEALAGKLPAGRNAITVKTVKDKREKFGRYLARLEVDGEDVNAWLLDQGLARPYTISSAVLPGEE